MIKYNSIYNIFLRRLIFYFQLLDLRQVIARMLGLDINNLAVPDYEIIARLEKLILAHQSGVITDAAIGTIVDDMEEGFR